MFPVREDACTPCRYFRSVGNGVFTHERQQILNHLLPDLGQSRISGTAILGRIDEGLAFSETLDDQAVSVIVGCDEQFPVDIATEKRCGGETLWENVVGSRLNS